MTSKELHKIIQKYLEGKASTEEINLLERLDNKAEERIKETVFASEQEKQLVYDEIYKGINERINFSHKNKGINYRVLSIAASIVLLVSISVGLYFNSNVNAKEQAPVAIVQNITKQTDFGQKLTLSLPDGSKVKLNAGSKLTFPETFSDTLRMVRLQGEAFFDVVKNPNKPFIIQTGDLETTVLGTTFNVEAYNEQQDVKVTLATGKVKVEVDNETAFLEPSQQATFNKNSKKIAKEKVDLQKALGWKNNTLLFENESLKTIIPQLERWYDVDINLKDVEMGECRLTGTFKNESIESIFKNFTFVKRNMVCKFISPKVIEIYGKCENE